MHTITSIQFFTSAKGNKYARAMIGDKEVAIFDKYPGFETLKAGDQVEGDITQNVYNGKTSYSLDKRVVPPAWATKGPSGIVKAQERKAEGIAKTMDRKEDGIKTSSTFRDATILTQAWIAKGEVPFPTFEDVQRFWLKTRSWLLDNYDVDNSKPPF